MPPFPPADIVGMRGSVYGHTTTAMNDMSTPPPLPSTVSPVSAGLGVCTSGGGLESRDEGGREALSAARIGGMRSGRVDRPCNRPPARLCPKMPSYHRRARFDPFFDGPPPAFYTENNIVRPEQALRSSKPKGGYGDQNQRWSPKGMFPAMLTYQYTNEVAHV